MSRLLSALIVFPLAFAAAACSDPPPTPAAMGISINLVKPELTDFPPNTDLGSKSCPAGAGQATYIIGQPAANKTIENGKGGVKVTCQVRGDGTFSAAAAGFDGYTQQRISMNISGRITDRASQTAAGEGVMQFYTPDTNALHTNTQKFPGCSFGPVTTLKKGAILTDIMCPILITDDNPSDGCKVKGTIAFEYCTTGEEEE
jgi:hypothetical protein